VFSERELIDAFTGLVVDGFAVGSEAGAAETACGQCDRTLSAGDPVTATLTYYEEHTWEPTGVYCTDHPARSVDAAMGVTAEDQAVIEATLERTGYLDPTGEFHPNALTFGGTVVIDYSPAAAGYD
jgi:hypothetical protein